MRQLGSHFHIGMNGMKASDQIFAFLDLPEKAAGQTSLAKKWPGPSVTFPLPTQTLTKPL